MLVSCSPLNIHLTNSHTLISLLLSMSINHHKSILQVAWHLLPLLRFLKIKSSFHLWSWLLPSLTTTTNLALMVCVEVELFAWMT